jgi:hypothetical protein
MAAAAAGSTSVRVLNCTVLVPYGVRYKSSSRQAMVVFVITVMLGPFILYELVRWFERVSICSDANEFTVDVN